jgi:hypothetical protein
VKSMREFSDKMSSEFRLVTSRLRTRRNVFRNTIRRCPIQRDWYKMAAFRRKPETGVSDASLLEKLSDRVLKKSLTAMRLAPQTENSDNGRVRVCPQVMCQFY